MNKINGLPDNLGVMRTGRTSKFGIKSTDLALDQLTKGSHYLIEAAKRSAFATIRAYVYRFNKDHGTTIQSQKLMDGSLCIYILPDGIDCASVGITSGPVVASNESLTSVPTIEQFKSFVLGLPINAAFEYRITEQSNTPIDRIKFWCQFEFDEVISCKEISPDVLSIARTGHAAVED